ncbi:MULTISPECIES: helix-turn-helix transcriptional regulator [Brevibacillus]|uniref:helix-turn-helix transcriptional regulator n=1 Tax=Brevibacillus TaxID=55080 RepID=UPI001C8D7ABC|nr:MULTISPECIES: helix-turn-helix transcriptional regulator [Brevibacillus]MBY0088419.1 helix-turn-helix transcriptional regulator [Brevibacillus brevis]
MKKYTKKPRQRFKELRASKGTQLQVALAMGLTETTVRHLESGYVDPSIKTMFAFARFFETDVYDLWPDLAYSSE